MFYSILNSRFDSNLLVDSALNTPFHPENDIFYKPLLSDIHDKKLLDSVLRIRDCRVSLNNLSHVPYLLPWSLQHSLGLGHFNEARGQPDRDSGDLKQNLTKYINAVKSASLISSGLLKLRFIGFSNRKDLIYRRLRLIYRHGQLLCVLCRINGRVVRHEGRLLLFDIDLNLVLMGESIIYISL
ncbi:hypothetical protein TOT_040000038 [Theileria orientalis strain Shintoku]|uniref:Uncharacterized protein n=1 Tax=Theileria orientalis strain Shintoku TaxID=869250 RepID=J4CDS6_THEOR|nr:LOW QUALITY PROTEIN: hypothetical protein TOT_040000038 [Theileria orientalis strain Shintoku]BAM41657.1 hypothetical protein TOT_040000038 [Theileria orientalis strain Shintoku]|eukprot:XP_009691958.1 LOW QUALITY PROTEIN: hypothetical protein TOT_040000038 [Theileria orientalis strain Shintoku]